MHLKDGYYNNAKEKKGRTKDQIQGLKVPGKRSTLKIQFQP